MKNQKGFSLIELLVVVIIIAIIAAIAIPNLLSSRRAANEASAVSNLRTIHTAQATYAATNAASGEFASSFATLSAAPGLLDTSWNGTPLKNTFTYTIGVDATPATKYCVQAKSSDTNAKDFGVQSDGTILQAVHGGVSCGAATGVLTGTGVPVGSA